MTTIPQRLREIAVRIGTHDMAAYVQLRAIANELEAPAADAVPVVAYMIETNAGVGFVTPLDGRNPCAPWLPLIRQRDHIAAIASEREHAIKLRETFLRMQQEHAGSVAALQDRINELESRQWFLADETDDAQDDVWSDAAYAYAKAAGCLRGHLEWRDRIRAAVRVLIASVPHPDTSKEQP